MLIDSSGLISKQLALTQATVVEFPDGRTTTLAPVHYIPQLTDPSMRVSLNGAWAVVRWPFTSSEQVLAEVLVDDSGWEVVELPGKVFTQDVSTPSAQIPGWDRIGLRHIDPDDGAVIRRNVPIPESWSGKRVYLTFDGIYPGGRVYVNGCLLGEHTSGLTPVEWDVTDIVEPGQTAFVAVRILRRYPFVKMDMPRHSGEFAGLSQPAYFHAVEPCHIANHHFTAQVDDTLASGVLSGPVSISNVYGSQNATGTLVVSVSHLDGTDVALVSVPVSVSAGTSIANTVELAVFRPSLWNDEYPNLYLVTIKLSLTGLDDQVISYRTGFRRLDSRNSRPILNGNPVKFRGVNHLTYHPDHGLFTPELWLRQCLTLMKRANVNCVRTHYLGPRILADLCDELGLYLIQELPIDWGTDYIADPLWVGPALQRIQGGVLRDRHHPSVVIWSVGNENMPSQLAEAEHGYHHLRIYDEFVKTLDASRPTMFPPPGPANTIRGILEVRVGDIADTHYSFNHIKGFLETGSVENPIAWDGGTTVTTRDEAIARGWSGVWFSSEYGIANLIPDLLRAPYGDIINDVPVDPDSGRSTLDVFTERLRREWGYMRDEPSCLGGAYFPWICGAAGKNPWGWTVWAEDNDWGVVTADLLPKPVFWAMRHLFSPVWFPDRVRWQVGDEAVRFEITNQFNAIELRECTVRTMLSWAKGPSTRSWRDIPVTCAPGSSADIEIPLWEPESIKSLSAGVSTVLRIVLLTPAGFHVLTHDIMIVPDNEDKDQRDELLIGPDARL